MRLLGLAVLLVDDTNNRITILQQTGDSGLLEDLDTVGLGNSKVLQTLHLGVGDNHARELRATTVCARLGVSTETRHLGEIKLELLLQPVDSIARPVSKDVDKVVSCKVASLSLKCKRYEATDRSRDIMTHRFLRVLEEDLCRVWDALLLLGRSARAIDTRGSLGGVPAHKPAK